VWSRSGDRWLAPPIVCRRLCGCGVLWISYSSRSAMAVLLSTAPPSVGSEVAPGRRDGAVALEVGNSTGCGLRRSCCSLGMVEAGSTPTANSPPLMIGVACVDASSNSRCVVPGRRARRPAVAPTRGITSTLEEPSPGQHLLTTAAQTSGRHSCQRDAAPGGGHGAPSVLPVRPGRAPLCRLSYRMATVQEQLHSCLTCTLARLDLKSEGSNRQVWRCG
jgi:hypothetical protein